MLDLKCKTKDSNKSQDSTESKMEMKALKIRNIKAQLKESLISRYNKARALKSEFQDLTDSEIQTYIDAYDNHIEDGFQSNSIELMVGGSFMFFNNILFLVGGCAGSITAEKEPGHIVSMSIISVIVSTVGSAFAIAGQSMLKFDSINQEQNITLKFDLT